MTKRVMTSYNNYTGTNYYSNYEDLEISIKDMLELEKYHNEKVIGIKEIEDYDYNHFEDSTYSCDASENPYAFYEVKTVDEDGDAYNYLVKAYSNIRRLDTVYTKSIKVDGKVLHGFVMTVEHLYEKYTLKTNDDCTALTCDKDLPIEVEDTLDRFLELGQFDLEDELDENDYRF